MCPTAVVTGKVNQGCLGKDKVSAVTPPNDSLDLFLKNSTHSDSPPLTLLNSKNGLDNETPPSNSSSLESAEISVFPNCNLSTSPSQPPCRYSQPGNRSDNIDCISNSSSSPVDPNFIEAIMVVTAPTNNSVTSPPASTEHLKTVVIDTEETTRPLLSVITSPSQHQPTSPRFSITTIEDSQLPLNEPSTPTEPIPVIYHRSSVVASPQSTIVTQSVPNHVTSLLPQTSPPPPPVVQAAVLPSVTSLTEPITEPMTTMSIQEDEESHPLPRKADPERVLEYGGPNNRYAKVYLIFIL